MYKDNLKDVVAGDEVVLLSQWGLLSLVKVDRVLKTQIITSDNKRFDKNGKGLTYKRDIIYAPLQIAPYSDRPAIERYEAQVDRQEKYVVIDELKAYDFYNIPTKLIKEILVMLKEEDSKHV